MLLRQDHLRNFQPWRIKRKNPDGSRGFIGNGKSEREKAHDKTKHDGEDKPKDRPLSHREGVYQIGSAMRF